MLILALSPASQFSLADVLQLDESGRYRWNNNRYSGLKTPREEGVNTGGKPARDRYLPLVRACADSEHDLPWQMLDAVIQAESNYDADAVSPKGAIGLAQLMPATASMLGVDPYNVRDNICGGGRYLQILKGEFQTWTLVLAAYNAGPEAVRKYNYQIPPYPETVQYVEKVLVLYAGRVNNHSN